MGLKQNLQLGERRHRVAIPSGTIPDVETALAIFSIRYSLSFVETVAFGLTVGLKLGRMPLSEILIPPDKAVALPEHLEVLQQDLEHYVIHIEAGGETVNLESLDLERLLRQPGVDPAPNYQSESNR